MRDEGTGEVCALMPTSDGEYKQGGGDTYQDSGD